MTFINKVSHSLFAFRFLSSNKNDRLHRKFLNSVWIIADYIVCSFFHFVSKLFAIRLIAFYSSAAAETNNTPIKIYYWPFISDHFADQIINPILVLAHRKQAKMKIAKKIPTNFSAFSYGNSALVLRWNVKQVERQIRQ